MAENSQFFFRKTYVITHPHIFIYTIIWGLVQSPKVRFFHLVCGDGQLFCSSIEKFYFLISGVFEKNSSIDFDLWSETNLITDGTVVLFLFFTLFLSDNLAWFSLEILLYYYQKFKLAFLFPYLLVLSNIPK